jgi:energy-coupling factor transporter ATP-binding protein EcfA2
VDEIAAFVRSRPAVDGIRLVGVDGPSGAGKSTLAARLAALLDAPIIELDDFVSWDCRLGRRPGRRAAVPRPGPGRRLPGRGRPVAALDGRRGSLLHHRQHPGPSDPSVHYLVDDVPDAVATAQSAGCVVRERPFDIAVGKCAVLEDPFGNLVCILDMSRGPRPSSRTTHPAATGGAAGTAPPG